MRAEGQSFVVGLCPFPTGQAYDDEDEGYDEPYLEQKEVEGGLVKCGAGYDALESSAELIANIAIHLSFACFLH